MDLLTRIVAFAEGALLMSVVGVLLGTAAFGQATIALSKSVGPPTSTVKVSGQGFPADDTIEIFFAHKHVGQAQTGSDGSFSRVATSVPKKAQPGHHRITAKALDTGTEAKSSFLVRTDWLQFGLKHRGGRHNSYENALNADNAGRLTLLFRFAVGFNSASSPSVAEGIVYVAGGDGNAYAVREETGDLLWSYPAGGTSSPAISEDTVYFSTQGACSLLALERETGTLQWCYPGQSVPSSPTFAYGRVYFGSFDDNVYALDAKTGDQLWQFPTGNVITSTPAVFNGVVYVGSWDGSLYALNADTGSLLWTYNTGTNAFSPVVANNTVFVSSYSGFYALDARTGALRWTYVAGGPPFSSPAVANGVVYVGTQGGGVRALDVITGKLVWNQVPPVNPSSPSVANGVVYVGAADNSVYAFNVDRGFQVWTYQTGGVVASSLTIVDGTVYFVSEDGNLYAFGLPH